MVWKAIEDSTDPEDFATFIEQYPDSALVPFAHKRIAALRTQERGETISRPAPPEPTSGESKPAIGTEAALAPAPESQPEQAEPTAPAPDPAAIEAALDLSREQGQEIQIA